VTATHLLRADLRKRLLPTVSLPLADGMEIPDGTEDIATGRM